MITKEELDRIHKKVPVDYYQKGIQKNFLQKYWHSRCFAFIADEVSRLKLKGPILDVGCHSGDRTNLIYQTTGAEVHGLDLSEEAIRYARSRFPQLNFIVNDFPRDVAFQDNYFEAITAFDVMEHIPDTDQSIAEIRRLLKPGGYLIVGVPHENILFRLTWYFWTKLKGQVWDGVHVHDFQKEGFEIFTRNGFKVIRDKKIIFNMWWIVVFKLDK